MLANLSRVGRTMAYSTEVENTIAALTPAQVNAAMRQHFAQPALVIVTAGDFEAQTAGSQP
jgi:predicted Zn-dependent peptidase